MSSARLVMTATYRLQGIAGRYAMCTVCTGGGQVIVMVIQRTGVRTTHQSASQTRLYDTLLPISSRCRAGKPFAISRRTYF